MLITTPYSTDSELSLPSSASSDSGYPATATPLDDADHDEGVGLSNPQLSQDRRRTLDIVNRLHSTGVGKDIDLPMIAVIGSQSAGKSSLIESISGITLPRAAGTCTRCPTECRLSYSTEPWKCLVELRFDMDGTHQRRTVPFGAPIFSKSEVEERIRRAQRAILNPSQPPKTFLEDDDDDGTEKSEMSFSSNFVSLSISGRDVADLSFCDLPGLIASVGTGGNSSDIKLVESLVNSYICKPSCLVLLTVTCETDFENQGAYTLAKTNDPVGKRTIGVLTKPDRVPSGEEDRWLRFIRNEIESLENNWYCVKQPDSKALKQGISWKDARRREDEFFAMTSPWSTLDSLYKRYLGTGNLTERLSHILSELISKRLPEIQEELQSHLYTTDEEIKKLPRPPSSDPLGEVMQLIGIFIRDLERQLEGTPEEGGLLQSIHPMQVKFKKSIRDTAPEFKPFERKFASAKSLPKPNFLDNEEESSEIVPTTDNSIYVDEVFTRAATARTRELPDNYPFRVQEAYISEIRRKWQRPAEVLFQETQGALIGYVKELIKKHFGDFGRGELHQRVLLVLSEHIKNCCERTTERVDWLVRLEERPFSLNEHYFRDYKAKFMTHYKGWRHKDKNSALMTNIKNYSPTWDTNKSGIGKVMAGLAELGVTNIAAMDIAKLLPSDPVDPALTIMADVRAYFQVAYKRFADNVPMAVDLELVRGLTQGIEPVLYSGLGISGPDGRRICKDLVQEHPNVTSRRQELTKKWERLHMASQELVTIGG